MTAMLIQWENGFNLAWRGCLVLDALEDADSD
jgi:hypothetical protein